MTLSELSNLSTSDIRTMDKNAAVDITSIKIDSEQNVQNRIENYLGQIKNPYCFRVNNTLVKVSFSSDTNSLQKTLSRYLTSFTQ